MAGRQHRDQGCQVEAIPLHEIRPTPSSPLRPQSSTRKTAEIQTVVVNLHREKKLKRKAERHGEEDLRIATLKKTAFEDLTKTNQKLAAENKTLKAKLRALEFGSLLAMNTTNTLPADSFATPHEEAVVHHPKTRSKKDSKKSAKDEKQDKTQGSSPIGAENKVVKEDPIQSKKDLKKSSRDEKQDKSQELSKLVTQKDEIIKGLKGALEQKDALIKKLGGESYKKAKKKTRDVAISALLPDRALLKKVDELREEGNKLHERLCNELESHIEDLKKIDALKKELADFDYDITNHKSLQQLDLSTLFDGSKREEVREVLWEKDQKYKALWKEFATFLQTRSERNILAQSSIKTQMEEAPWTALNEKGSIQDYPLAVYKDWTKVLEREEAKMELQKIQLCCEYEMCERDDLYHGSTEQTIHDAAMVRSCTDLELDREVEQNRALLAMCVKEHDWPLVEFELKYRIDMVDKELNKRKARGKKIEKKRKSIKTELWSRKKSRVADGNDYGHLFIGFERERPIIKFLRWCRWLDSDNRPGPLWRFTEWIMWSLLIYVVFFQDKQADGHRFGYNWEDFVAYRYGLRHDLRQRFEEYRWLYL